MEIKGPEWVTLREAEHIIGRSRRQIWRYINDGSWDTRTLTDNMNRQVTYIKLADLMKKKTELESLSNLDLAQIVEKEVVEDIKKDLSVDLTHLRQLLESLNTNQDYQNKLLTGWRILMIVAAVGIVIIAVCSILNVIL